MLLPLMYVHKLIVPSSAIDVNGHVNNVVIVQWMQDAAIAHADAVGCSAVTKRMGATWVVRRHTIEYRKEAFAGDHVEVRTQVVDCRRVSSRRQYEFVRESDGAVLARGESDWVLINWEKFEPIQITDEIKALFNPPPAGGVTEGGDSRPPEKV
jgi:acyl-CoA thioester hydrolase